MKTEKFPHEKFLEDNNIDYKTLPEMLYKRIKGFEEMKEDLQHMTNEDKEKLTEKLEMLSHELLEDLEEHFEDHLENNEQEEEEPQPEPALESGPVVEEPIVEQEPKQPVVEAIAEPEPKPEKTPSDEEILEGLLADRKIHVSPLDLRSKGFKSALNSKKLMVGKFCLHMGKYDTCYKIVINQE